MAKQKLDTVARGKGGRFVKKTAPDATIEPIVRGEGGRFLPKTALAQFSEQLGTINSGRTIKESGFQLSDLPRMQMGRLAELRNPEAMIASVRNSSRMMTQVVQSLNHDNEIQQRSYTILTGDQKKLVTGQEELSQLFDLDVETNQENTALTGDMRGELKNIAKYSEVNADLLNRILDTMEREDAQSKREAFSRALVKSNTAVPATIEGEGGEGGGMHLPGLGVLGKIVGAILGYKVLKRVIFGPRAPRTPPPNTPKDEPFFGEGEEPPKLTNEAESPKQLNAPEGFKVEKPSWLPDFSFKGLVKGLATFFLPKSALGPLALAAGLVQPSAIPGAMPIGSQAQENALMGRANNAPALGHAKENTHSDLTLPEVVVKAKRIYPQTNPGSQLPPGTMTGLGPSSVPSEQSSGGGSTYAPYSNQGGGVPSTYGPASPIPQGKGDITPSDAIDYFKSRGWSQEQAAGIVANLQSESGLKSHAVGDGGAAYGMGQWHPDRQANFKAVYGHDIRDSTPQEQLSFADWELNNTEKRAGDRLKQAKDAKEAGAIVSQFDERPADVQGEAMRRGALAQQLAGNSSTAALQGSTQAQTGQALSNASETRDRLQAVSSASNSNPGPTVIAPTNVSAPNHSEQTAGMMPSVRNDDPTYLKAIYGDLKTA